MSGMVAVRLSPYLLCKNRYFLWQNRVIRRSFFQLAAASNAEVTVLSPRRSHSGSPKSIYHHSVLHHGSSSPLRQCEDGVSQSNNLLSKFNFTQKTKPLLYLNDRTVTYGDFERTIIDYSKYLRSQCNVRKGDRVAAQVTKSPNALALYLATLQLGAVYVPLNTGYKKDEISYFLVNAEPSVFVCRRADLEMYKTLMSNGYKTASVNCVVVDEEEMAGRIGEEKVISDKQQIEKVSSDDLAAILYTSGTTGQPKGAMITHGNLSSNADVLCKFWRITQDDVLLHAMPIYHAHGLFIGVNTILMAGGSIIFLPRFELDAVLESLKKSTIMMGVPTYYTRLLSSDKFDLHLVAHMRVFIAGSAPLLESTWREFKERTGSEILERYGMTEGQMVCSNPYDGMRKPGTVGQPLPGVNARIRNSCLQYKGPNLFKGYWRMPEKTKEDFTDDGYFISGDLAEYDSDGYIRIMGRSKDLIISGGLNVYPKEIEHAVDSLPDVIESAVIGVLHPDFGEAVVAVVVLRDGSQQDAKNREQEMITTLKEKIAAFKAPKRIFFQEQLPRNAMGKVQKNILREKYRNVFPNV